MGLFSNDARYSTEEKVLRGEQIKHILWDKLYTIKEEHKTIVEQAIKDRRGDDKKISLEQIYQVLLKLEQAQEISNSDRHQIMEVFKTYFEEHLS